MSESGPTCEPCPLFPPCPFLKGTNTLSLEEQTFYVYGDNQRNYIHKQKRAINRHTVFRLYFSKIMKFCLVFFFVHLACSSCYSLQKEDDNARNDISRRLAMVRELLGLKQPNYLTAVSFVDIFVLFLTLSKQK
jgi:hypothetical protein